MDATLYTFIKANPEGAMLTLFEDFDLFMHRLLAVAAAAQYPLEPDKKYRDAHIEVKRFVSGLRNSIPLFDFKRASNDLYHVLGSLPYVPEVGAVFDVVGWLSYCELDFSAACFYLAYENAEALGRGVMAATALMISLGASDSKLAKLHTEYVDNTLNNFVATHGDAQ